MNKTKKQEINVSLGKLQDELAVFTKFHNRKIWIHQQKEKDGYRIVFRRLFKEDTPLSNNYRLQRNILDTFLPLSKEATIALYYSLKVMLEEDGIITKQ